MSDGIDLSVNELIELRRHAQKVQYSPDKSAARTGNHLSKFRGRGMDFAEVRNYQAGDEIRHMEWRVTARTGRPHIKVYQEERERPVVVVNDFNPSMYFGSRVAFKSVTAARLAALIGWTACRQGDRVGGLVYSAQSHHEFMPRSREKGILPWLSCLSQYTRDSEASHAHTPRAMSDVLIRLKRVCRPGSILVIIGDFYHIDAESEKHLSRLRAHNDILFYQICDALELLPPKPALYAISDGQQEALFDTRNDRVHQGWLHYCQKQQQTLRDFCKRLQIEFTMVTAEEDLVSVVRRTYPGRSRV